MWWAVQGGALGLIVGLFPAVFLISPSLSNIFSGGDARISQFMATGAFMGIVLSFPIVLTSSLFSGIVLLIFSTASFVAAGYLAVGEAPVPADVPEPKMGLKLSARSAFDEIAMFALVLTTWPQAVGSQARRISREVDAAIDLFEQNGWLEDPASYHRTPPAAEGLSYEKQPYKEWNFVHLSFESGYEPWPEEPGRDRWLSYEANRTAHALALRHPGGPRPWLVCIHGLRNGSPHKSPDVSQPEFFHRELGLNLLFPFLPLHGPRSPGPLNGVQLLSGDFMDLLHTGTQAAWDIRRLLAWLKLPDQSAPAIGVLGHSLGGYVSALLASLERDLDCVISGNPAVDPIRLYWNNTLAIAIHSLRAQGIRQGALEEIIRPISPLALQPVIPRNRRAIFAGTVDRVVPPIEAYSLWRHWERPRIGWHQGSHTRFLQPPESRTTLEETLHAAGMLYRHC